MKAVLTVFFATIALSFIDLEKRTLLNEKIEILVPKEFKEMSKDLIDIKYPGKNRPTLILTDEPGTTNLAFSILENAADSTVIENYKEALVNSYKSKFPTATWLSNGVTRINDKKVGFLKLITDARDQKIFNYLFFTDLEGKLLIGTFNCVEKDMKTWQVISEQVVRSLKIK